MRHWKTLSTSFATLSARLASVATLLVINGVASRRMSHDQFGLWSVLFSINLLSNNLDLGFRFTLGNRIAALGSKGVEGDAERRETYLAILLQQALLAVVLIAVALVISPLLPWTAWFKVTDPAMAADVRRIMPPVLALMLCTLPVALMWTVFFGYQEIKLASLLSGFGAVAQAVVFVAAAYLFPFDTVMYCYFATNVLIGVTLTAYVFIRRRWRFSLLPVSRIHEVTASMAPISIHAFLFGMSSMIAMVLGTIVSGTTAGLSAAGDFTLVQKVFSLLITAHLALLAPVTPAVTRDSHAGDWDAVRQRLRTCVVMVWPAVFVAMGLVLLYAHPLILRLWAGKWIANYPLAMLLLGWACLNGFVNTFAVFLNGLGLMKIQAAVSIAMILPTVLLPNFLGRWLGMPGVALALMLCLLPSVVVWPLYTRRALLLKKLRV